LSITSGDTIHIEEAGLRDGENSVLLFSVDSKDEYFTMTEIKNNADWMIEVIDNGQTFDIKCEEQWVSWACGETTEIEPEKCAQVQSGDLRDEHGCTQYEFYLPSDTQYYDAPVGSMSDILEDMVNAISTDMNQIDDNRHEFIADALLATTADGEAWFSSDQTRVSESASSKLAMPIHYSSTTEFYEVTFDGWSPAVFKLRADTDGTEVELISGTYKETKYLSTADTEFTVPLDRRGRFQINNVNGGNVYFTSDTAFEIYNDGLWGAGDNWNCGTGSEGSRCDTVRNGNIKWGAGIYSFLAPRESIDSEGTYFYTMCLDEQSCGKEQNQEYYETYPNNIGWVCVTEEDMSGNLDFVTGVDSLTNYFGGGVTLTTQWQQKGECGLWSLTFTQDDLMDMDMWVRHDPDYEEVIVNYNQVWAQFLCEFWITSVEARLPTLSEVQNGCVAMDETLPNYDTYKKIQLWTSSSISNQSGKKADYHLVKGRCEDYVLPCVTIRSKADCNTAATYLELDDTSAYALTSMAHDLNSKPGGCYLPASGQLKYNPKLDSDEVDHGTWTRICDCRTFEKDFPFSISAYGEEWVVSDGELVDKDSGVRFSTKYYANSEKTLLTFQADKEYATFEKVSISHATSGLSSSDEEAVSGSILEDHPNYVAELMEMKTQNLPDNAMELIDAFLDAINNQETDEISQISSESTIEQVSEELESDSTVQQVDEMLQSESTIQQVDDMLQSESTIQQVDEMLQSESTIQQVDEMLQSESTIQQVIAVLENESSVVRTLINILAFTGSLSTIYAGYFMCYKRNNNYENVDSGDNL